MFPAGSSRGASALPLPPLPPWPPGRLGKGWLCWLETLPWGTAMKTMLALGQLGMEGLGNRPGTGNWKGS